MPTFTYPSNYSLTRISQDYTAAERAQRVGLQLFPVAEENAGEVRWVQKDNFYGMQQLRGLDGTPTHVQRVGEKVYSYDPGVFGDFILITETELTKRAGSISSNEPISIADMITDANQQLDDREMTLQEHVVWKLLTSGTFSITSGNQTWSDTFAIQTYARATAWTDYANSTPLQDFRNAQQLSLGHAVSFGSNAKMYANRVTANYLLANKNTGDIGGRRNAYGATINSIPDANSIFLGEDLPQLVIYDGGYMATKGAASLSKFIPDGKIVVVGARTNGAPVGEYKLTRNMVNGGKPGSYRKVLDTTTAGSAAQTIVPKIEVHAGHNGGPVLYYPSAIVAMTVN